MLIFQYPFYCAASGSWKSTVHAGNLRYCWNCKY